jgi:hypothetical protein
MIREPGRCALCLRIRPLQTSHLLPAALYRMLRQFAGGPDPSPVMTTPSRSLTTSRQVSARLLCVECEARFADNGERYVLSQCARPDGQFKLRKRLETIPPLESDGQIKVYDVDSLLGKTLNPYLYLAASVFWRASAHTWHLNAEATDPFSLGAGYQEQFRLYLLGQATFPQDARIWLHVSSDALPMVVFPCTATVEGALRHKFYIPGLLFILFLGDQVPYRFDGRALNGSRRRVMWVCPWENDSLFRGSLSRIKESTPVGALRERIAKQD